MRKPHIRKQGTYWACFVGTRLDPSICARFGSGGGIAEAYEAWVHDTPIQKGLTFQVFPFRGRRWWYMRKKRLWW